VSHDEHVRRLEEKVARQAGSIRDFQRVNEFRVRQLDALHHVWCTGACDRGVHRFGEHPPLTRELLGDALACVSRMAQRVLSQEWREAAGRVEGPITAETIRAICDADPTRATLAELAATMRRLGHELAGRR
jgi:hypothetical protein